MISKETMKMITKETARRLADCDTAKYRNSRLGNGKARLVNDITLQLSDLQALKVENVEETEIFAEHIAEVEVEQIWTSKGGN